MTRTHVALIGASVVLALLVGCGSAHAQEASGPQLPPEARQHLDTLIDRCYAEADRMVQGERADALREQREPRFIVGIRVRNESGALQGMLLREVTEEQFYDVVTEDCVYMYGADDPVLAPFLAQDAQPRTPT